jgi:hypothetical protein
MSDLVIISMHEKGFPQADFYAGWGKMSSLEFASVSPSPDSFFTMKRGDKLSDAHEKAQRTWPGSIIKTAIDEDDEDEE